MDDATRKPSKRAGSGNSGGSRGTRKRRSGARQVEQGDIPPTLTAAGIQDFSVSQSILAGTDREWHD